MKAKGLWQVQEASREDWPTLLYSSYPSPFALNLGAETEHYSLETVNK